MTDRELMQMALDALQKIYIAPEHEEYIRVWWPACEEAIKALRDRLEQPELKPVAWFPAPLKTKWGEGMVQADLGIDDDHTVSIYCEGDQIDKVEEMFGINKEPKALRDRLAQPEPEPVAWLIQYSDRHEFVWGKKPVFLSATVLAVEPLYTAPPKREWVGLTDKEYEQIIKEKTYWYEVAKAVEAKLKEKNT